MGTRLFLALVLFGLAACGQPEPGVPNLSDDEPKGAYTSTGVIEDGRSRPLVQDTRITLEFLDDGRLRVEAGCNTMNFRVRFDGGRMEVSDRAVTGSGCDSPLDEQDAWLVTFLEFGPLWILRNQTLTLQTGATRIVFDEGAYGLKGTRWVVKALIDDGTTFSAPAGTEATLVFGTASASFDTGCNEGTADVLFIASSVAVQSLSLTEQVCSADVMFFENALILILTEGPRYVINDATLELKVLGRSLVLEASD